MPAMNCKIIYLSRSKTYTSFNEWPKLILTFVFHKTAWECLCRWKFLLGNSLPYRLSFQTSKGKKLYLFKLYIPFKLLKIRKYKFLLSSSVTIMRCVFFFFVENITSLIFYKDISLHNILHTLVHCINSKWKWLFRFI